MRPESRKDHVAKARIAKSVAAGRLAVYIMSSRMRAAAGHNSKASDKDGASKSGVEWGVAITSTAARPPPYPAGKGRQGPAECLDAPIGMTAAGALVVLVVVPTVEAGAADEGAVELARILRANGHHAVVVSNGGRLEPTLAASGAETMRLDVASRSPLAILHNAFVLRRVIAERRCAVVHALARAPAWSALIAARMAGVPFVTTWYNGFREQNIFKRFYNGVMAHGERVIAVSDQIAGAVAARDSDAKGRIVVVPSRIDFAAFDPALVTPQRIAAVRSGWDIGAETRAIVVIGHILRRKGHHVVVQAARRLKELGVRDFTFVFIGEDPGRSSYGGELWDLVLATQTSDVIRIAGPPDDLPAAYGAATAVVAPAIQLEGPERSALEAMAMACPVITSDLAAGSETVLAPPGVGEDRELATALIRLLSAPEDVRQAVGRRGREHVAEQFASAEGATQMLALYVELARPWERLGCLPKNPPDAQRP
jgi:glycosyltransferase involved in cell wall biosynthesis